MVNITHTRGRLRAEPSLQLGPCAYAAENQRVGKTRRRSIYSADRRQPANRTAAKVTVSSCKLGNLRNALKYATSFKEKGQKSDWHNEVYAIYLLTVVVTVDMYGGLGRSRFRHSIIGDTIHIAIISSCLHWLDPQHRSTGYVDDRVSLCGRRLNALATTRPGDLRGGVPGGSTDKT